MQPHTVRVIYIVPSDAKEWLDAKQHATEVLEDLQHFFADEMKQRGHGPKTFEIARDADNDLLFDAKHSSIEKAQFQADPPEDIWKRAAGAARQNVHQALIECELLLSEEDI